jgi:hypothetical protein
MLRLRHEVRSSAIDMEKLAAKYVLFCEYFTRPLSVTCKASSSRLGSGLSVSKEKAE